MEHIDASGKLLKSASLTQYYQSFFAFSSGLFDYKRYLGDEAYILGFPNQEVRESYASYMLAEYIEKDWQEMEYTISHKLRMCLEHEQLKDAFQIFVPVINSTGYDITKHTEGYFHTIMHV